MRLHYIIFLISSILLLACSSETTGDVQLTLNQPGPVFTQTEISNEEPMDTDIKSGDVIDISIYSTDDPEEPYVFDKSSSIKVSGDSGSENFAKLLTADKYYRFFVEVRDSEARIKLNGGTEGVFYSDGDSLDVNIFLGIPQQMVAFSADNTASTISTYINEYGSAGAQAVALKNGSILLTGGFSFASDQTDAAKTTQSTSEIFNTSTLQKTKVNALKGNLAFHAVALLDDGSEAGQVVIAYGHTNEGPTYINSKDIYLYDPNTDNSTVIAQTGSSEGYAYATATTLNGDVYVIGGCNNKTATNEIVKISKESKKAEFLPFGLNEGRCKHTAVGFTVTDDNGEHPMLLVIGGTTNHASGNNSIETYVNTFAEVVDLNAGTSTPVSLPNTEGLRISQSSATLLHWDGVKGPENGILLIGGIDYARINADNDTVQDTAQINNKAFLFYRQNGEWKTFSESIPACPAPSMTTLGNSYSDTYQYAVLGCVFEKSSDSPISATPEIKSDNLGKLRTSVVSISAKSSSTGEFSFKLSSTPYYQDPNFYELSWNTSVVSNSFGQAFIFGFNTVYMVSSVNDPVAVNQ